MTYEEKKEYLSQYVNEKRRINAYLDDLHYWETIGESMTAGDSTGSNHSTKSKVETASVHIAGIKESILTDIKDSTQKREAVRNAVEQLKTSKYKSVLTEIYIAGKSREEVANDRGVSVDRINAMAKRAIMQMDF